MRRHLPGLLVFTLIIGFFVILFAAFRFLGDTPDAGLVPAITDERPVISNSAPIPYRVQLVQYDSASQLLTARLEVDRDVIGNHSTFSVVIAISDSENRSQISYLMAMGKVLSSQSEKVTLLIDAARPANLILTPVQNHYAAFSFGSSDGAVEVFEPNAFGSRAPIVYVHPKRTVHPRRQGPDSLE